jgi:outer membrane lipoprotein SlyB
MFNREETTMNKTILIAALAASFSFPVLADSCGADCGRVTGVHSEKREGKGTGVGAVAGGVAGGLLGSQVGHGKTNTVVTLGGAAGGAYLGHQAEKKLKEKKVFVVAVKMDAGAARNFEYGEQPAFAAGDRVKIVGGKLQRYSGR